MAGKQNDTEKTTELDSVDFKSLELIDTNDDVTLGAYCKEKVRRIPMEPLPLLANKKAVTLEIRDLQRDNAVSIPDQF